MKAISSSITKVVALIAAMVVALGTFGLAAAHAADYDTSTIADPADNGTITINPVEGDTVTRKFSGYKLASLKNVKTDSAGTALESFTVETNSTYTTIIETVMGQITDPAKNATLLAGFQADASYYNTAQKIDNPLGYIAFTYGGVNETDSPWGGDNGNGSKDRVMRQFADKLAEALADDATTYPADSTTLTTGENTLPQGLYLITETTGPAGNTTPSTTGAVVNSAPMIVSTTYTLTDSAGTSTTVNSGVGTIDLKATSPTITKEVTNGNGTDVASQKANPDFSIGDEVDYELTATIPSYTGYDIDTAGTVRTNARVFKIQDLAEPGLTINSVGPVTVTPAGADSATPLVKDTDYAVTSSTCTSDNTCTSDATDSYNNGGIQTNIDLANYVNMRTGTVSATNGTVASGGTITVTIHATLNSKANVSDATTQKPNKNKVGLMYSREPHNVSKGYIQEGGEVNVYTYKFTITKKSYDGTTLPGAQFAIKNNADGKYLKWTAATDTDGKNGTWGTLDAKPTAAASAAPADQSTSNAAGIFYSGADGTVSLSGLKAGTYTIEEIASPSGYLNALLPSFMVTIAPTYTADTATKPTSATSWGDYTINALTISNGKDSNDLVTASDNNAGNVDVTNVKSITQLPKTGAAGITFFVIVGVALIGAAALFAIRARKARQAV